MAGRRDLPAPYESPWLRLRRDLRSVAADLRLRLQRLLRLNREGALPRPPFWPPSLAAAFWPLLLLLLLLLLLPLLLPFGPRLERPPPAVPGSSVQEVREERPPDLPPDLPQQAPEPVPEDPPQPVSREPPQPLPEPADPLRASFEAEDPTGLILALRPDAAAGRLVLEVASSPGRERAERWAARARDLGYDQLELRTPGGRLLGRQALVGEGMILWTLPVEF
jgi:hypothetical protein